MVIQHYKSSAVHTFANGDRQHTTLDLLGIGLTSAHSTECYGTCVLDAVSSVAAADAVVFTLINEHSRHEAKQ
jgi:hypothetical protein